MKELSYNMLHSGRSGIRKMFNTTYGLDDLVSFAVGEPDFSAPQRVVDAANDCNNRGCTKYTPNAGLIELRTKVAKSLEEYDLHFDPESEIIITMGGMESLFMIMMVLLDEGDEVIMSDPYWSNYSQQVKLVGGTPVFVPVLEGNGFALDPADVQKAVTPKTKLIMVNSPANPTGGVVPLENLKAIAKIAIDNDLYVLTDEVYKRFLYDGRKHYSIAALPGMKERTLLVVSFSKSFAMTGWRIGYTCGPKEIVGMMTVAHEGVSSCPNSSAQLGAIAALDVLPGEFEERLALFDRRRHLIVDGFNSIDKLSCIMPAGAFYAFPNITKTGMTSEEFAVDLLNKGKVVLIPGSAFGEHGEGFLRLSYATSEENIKRGLERIEKYVREYVK
jgi:aminotransferase